MSKSIPENFSLTRPLILIGMMGAGKTSVGRELARLLKTAFFDADAEIEKAANLKTVQIFSQYGETEFRRMEREVILRLLKQGPCVLSLGGGAFINPHIREQVKEAGFSIWLKVDREILLKRVKGGATRPLLAGDDPAGKLAEILAEREPVYAQADLTTACDNREISGNARSVLEALGQHPRSPLVTA